MRFEKCILYRGLVVISGHFYEIWEVYGDPRGSYRVVYMKFGKRMGIPGDHMGSFI